MVELVRLGRTPEELSREFEPTAQSILNWVKQAERDQGVRKDGLTTDEREELCTVVSSALAAPEDQRAHFVELLFGIEFLSAVTQLAHQAAYPRSTWAASPVGW
jgi:transposase-like protein